MIGFQIKNNIGGSVMKIKGFEVKQGNNRFFMGTMKMSELIEKGEVDKYIDGHPDGYQRNLSDSRARAFGRYIDGGNISPTSILLNIRDASDIEEIDGYINIPDNATIWIVDGQHRVGGMKFAAERDPANTELEFPVIIMNKPTNYEEARQFVILNKTQKGVRTDLAERFLARAIREEGRGKLVDTRQAGVLSGILKNIEWIAPAIEIVDILNSDKKYPWYGQIQLPNAPKTGTVVSQKAFTDSLEPILKDTTFQGRQPQQIAPALGNYWAAIKELCIDAFNNPKEHVIQKTTGVFVLHKIFPRVTELCRDDRGNKILTKENIKTVLKDLPFVESEYWESNGIAGSRGTNRKAFASLVLDVLEMLEVGRETKEPDLVV